MTFIRTEAALKFADSHNTSVEIVAAIFELAQEGDEERMWSEPTADEIHAVIQKALSYCLSGWREDLHWGDEVFLFEGGGK